MTETPTPVEKVSQETMLAQFRERLQKLLGENQEYAKKIKDNEVVALKLQGAIEALEYFHQLLKNKQRGTTFPLFNGINNLEACSQS